MTNLNTLREVISNVVSKGVLLTVQPGGNHGDALIYKGANKFFDDNNINTLPLASGEIRFERPPQIKLNGLYDIYNIPTQAYKFVRNQYKYARHRNNPELSAVYIHGGGHFNDEWGKEWGGGVRCLKTVARYFDVPIIIGPISCHFTKTDPSSVLDSIDNELHILCREEYSHTLLENIIRNRNISLYVEDDTALYLDDSDLDVESFKGDFSLISLRKGKESINNMIDKTIEPPILARDISNDEENFKRFVDIASRADEIYTDRLHGAILGAILNKQVRFYENKYHKNKGVYEYSLSDNDNITFVPKEHGRRLDL